METLSRFDPCETCCDCKACQDVVPATFDITFAGVVEFGPPACTGGTCSSWNTTWNIPFVSATKEGDTCKIRYFDTFTNAIGCIGGPDALVTLEIEKDTSGSPARQLLVLTGPDGQAFTETIFDSAFYDCDALSNKDVPRTSVGAGAFCDWTSATCKITAV